MAGTFGNINADGKFVPSKSYTEMLDEKDREIKRLRVALTMAVKLPNGWTEADLKSLRDDLTKSHISALLSPEKLEKDEWYSSSNFVRGTCVQAAELCNALLEK